MDHISTRKVDRADLGQEATSPDHVRHGIVDDERPEHHEEKERLEAHAATIEPAMSAGVMTANIIWNRAKASSGMVGAKVSSAVSTPFMNRYSKPTDDATVIGAKGQREAHDAPHGDAHTDTEERGHDVVHHVLAPTEPTVEKTPSRVS